MVISILPSDETSELAVDLKVITKAQNISFAKDQDQKLAHHFFDEQDEIQKESVREEQTVNSAFYVEVIRRLLKRISRLRPQFRTEGSSFLLHDSASFDSALAVDFFLDNHGIVDVLEVSHPPYSPDLAPADFSLS
jgi:hypothetical protein